MISPSSDGLNPPLATNTAPDESIPPNILEHLSCLVDPEPSIQASWDDVTSQHDAGSYTYQNKCGTAESHQAWSRSSGRTVIHCGLAVSCAETQVGTTIPDRHEDLFIGAAPRAGPRRRSGKFAHGTQSDMRPHASDSLRCGPYPLDKPHRPIATRNFSKVVIPRDLKTAESRERREQAARVMCSGPPRTTALLRPISAVPLPCLLNRELILHACHVDYPEKVQEIKLVNKGLLSADPTVLSSLTSLKSIVLENNLLEDISPFGHVESLLHLNVACNKLSRMPALSSGLFYKLQVLDISFNAVPVSDVLSRNCDWSSLPSLRQLDLSGNLLTRLPDVMGTFPALVKLYLEFNELTGECLCPLAQLPCLEQLGLADNHISDIPQKAFRPHSFNRLKVLDVSRNRIRKAEALEALNQVWNGTTVYIGDNPIARKLRLHLLQPFLIPGARPGTVQLPCDAHEAVSSSLLAQGIQRQLHHEYSCTRLPVTENTCQRLWDGSSAASVVLKLSRNLPNRPTLAKSIMKSILSIKSHITDVSHTTWRTDDGASERLLNIFDTLNCEFSKWEQMYSVPEETTGFETEHELAQPGDAIDAGLEPAERIQACTELPTGTVDMTHETHEFLPGNIVDIPSMELNDPTERLAAQLGLDCYLLSHHTGLMGTDANGALSRLRFILARCTPNDDLRTMKPPQHQSHTECSALKQQPRRKASLTLLKLPEPASPHEQQVEMIHNILHGMRAKLSLAKEQIASQLHQYQHLLTHKARNSDSTRDRHHRPDSMMEPVIDRKNIPDHPQGQSDNVDTQVPSGDTVTRHELGPLDSMDIQPNTVTHQHMPENRYSALMHSGAQTKLEYVTE